MNRTPRQSRRYYDRSEEESAESYEQDDRHYRARYTSEEDDEDHYRRRRQPAGTRRRDVEDGYEQRETTRRGPDLEWDPYESRYRARDAPERRAMPRRMSPTRTYRSRDHYYRPHDHTEGEETNDDRDDRDRQGSYSPVRRAVDEFRGTVRGASTPRGMNRTPRTHPHSSGYPSRRSGALVTRRGQSPSLYYRENPSTGERLVRADCLANDLAEGRLPLELADHILDSIESGREVVLKFAGGARR